MGAHEIHFCIGYGDHVRARYTLVIISKRTKHISRARTEQRAQLRQETGGCGQMYEAIIVSPQFTKKTTLARHRLVNTALKDEIAAIHAWTPKCHTPEEWEKKKPQ